MFAHRLAERVTEMQGRSGLVEHSGVKEVGITVDGNARRAAGASILGIRNAGKTIGNAADPKRGRRNCPDPKGHAVTFVVAPAKTKFV